MMSNPSYFSRKGKNSEMVKDVPDAELARFPVENVQWTSVHNFLPRLNEREQGRGWVYRLPTDEEWEYACRGAPTTKDECAYDFYFDRPTNDIPTTAANLLGTMPDGNGGTKARKFIVPFKVGLSTPNRLGIYDMHSNVWEWTSTKDNSGHRIRGGSSAYTSSVFSAGNVYHLTPKNSEPLIFLGLRLAAVPAAAK
jgi:formylglycine-generating enzyme required for sulfatase activity